MNARGLSTAASGDRLVWVITGVEGGTVEHLLVIPSGTYKEQIVVDPAVAKARKWRREWHSK